MSGNGTKRGLLRPGHSGRIPLFAVVFVVALVVFFLYNAYSNSLNRSYLQNANDELEEQAMICYKGKLDAEQKFETLTKTCKEKSQSDDVKFTLLKNTNKDTIDKLHKIKQEMDQVKTDLEKAVVTQKQLEDNLTKEKINSTNLLAENSKLIADMTEMKNTNDMLATKNEELSSNPKASRSSNSELYERSTINQKMPSLSDDIVFQRTNMIGSGGEHNESDAKNNTSDGDSTDEWQLSKKLKNEKLALEEQSLSINETAQRENDPRYVQQTITRPTLESADRRDMDEVLMQMSQEQNALPTNKSANVEDMQILSSENANEKKEKILETENTILPPAEKTPEISSYLKKTPFVKNIDFDYNTNDENTANAI